MPPVTPKKDKNGNSMYLDAEIERGKQFGYWSRTLGIRILGLSDLDPEDVGNTPEQLLKSYETWSKANANDKLVYKKEFMDICEDNGIPRGDITDYFSFLGVDITDDKEKHNSIVQFLRSKDNFVNQIESYKLYKIKELGEA